MSRGAALAVLALVTIVGLVPAAPGSAAGGIDPPDPVYAEALSATQIKVTWFPAPTATSYRVLRATVSGGPYTLLTTTTVREFLDTGVRPATTYHYVVQSVYRNRFSRNSVEATATTPFTKPTGLRPTATETTVDLQWDPVPGAVRYEILRLGDDGVEVMLGPTTTNSYLDTGLPTGLRHRYWVRAVAANGLTGLSDSALAYTGAPTITTLTMSPVRSEQGQRVLLVANVRYADGRIPSGQVAFMSDGGAVGFATIDGRTGDADLVPSLGWVPTTVFAQYEGYDYYVPAGASTSVDVPHPVDPAFGSVSYYGPSWLEIGSWEEGVATGDLTGDGLPDVVLTTTEYFDDAHDHSVFLFVQEPANTLVLRYQYATSSPQGGSMFPAIGDLDGDGRNDLLVASGDGVDVYRQQGGSGLGPPSAVSFGGGVTDFRLVDLDLDGRRDIVAMTVAGILARFGTEGGDLAPPVAVSPHWGPVLDVEDISGDGRPDVVAQHDETVEVTVQGAGRTFAAPVGYPIPFGYMRVAGSLATGDVTGDGLADVVVTVGGNSPGARVQVLTRTAGGTFGQWIQYPVWEIPDSLVLADMNNDGRLDVVVAHGGWRRSAVLLQRPDGRLGRDQLGPQQPPASDFSVRGLAVDDINNDGLKDIVLANYNAGLVVVPLAGAGSTATVDGAAGGVVLRRAT